MQRAVTFLLKMQEDSLGHQWHLAVSDRVLAELRRIRQVALPDHHIFRRSPARDRQSRRRLAELEQTLRPDCVFTFAGPAYARFRAPHLMGCALGWVTHSTFRDYRRTWRPHWWMIKACKMSYHASWLRRASAWVVQTETARQGLHRRLRIPLDRIAVVANTCGASYLEHRPSVCDWSGNSRYRFLCFSAPYPHKRLELIPSVAKELTALEPSLDFEFVLTVPGDSALWRRLLGRSRALGVSSRIVNHGPVAVADGPALYESCHVCFLPTLLETFSATYPEAMAMNRPIVTTHLGFAKDVCQDAALYFDVDDTKSAAHQLLRLVRNEPLRGHLITEGNKVLAALPSPGQQYRRYVELLAELVRRDAR